MANSINELSKCVKKARTSLWSLVQISNVNYKQSQIVLNDAKANNNNNINNNSKLSLMNKNQNESLFDTLDKTREFMSKTFQIKTDLVSNA